MILSDLLQNISLKSTFGNSEIEVTGIQFDSRKVEDGSVFVATRGTATDGHDFIGAALQHEA